jgi:hypothetical protein
LHFSACFYVHEKGFFIRLFYDCANEIKWANAVIFRNGLHFLLPKNNFLYKWIFECVLITCKFNVSSYKIITISHHNQIWFYIYILEFFVIHMNEKGTTYHDCHGFKWFFLKISNFDCFSSSFNNLLGWFGCDYAHDLKCFVKS